MRLITNSEQRAVTHGYPRPLLLSHFQIATPFKEMSFYDRIPRFTRKDNGETRNHKHVILGRRYETATPSSAKTGASSHALRSFISRLTSAVCMACPARSATTLP